MTKKTGKKRYPRDFPVIKPKNRQAMLKRYEIRKQREAQLEEDGQSR